MTQTSMGVRAMGMSESVTKGEEACSPSDMMALDKPSLFTHQPYFDWDPHTFEVLEDLHESMPLVMESPMSSSVSSEASTGYLQDAVAEWNDRCKRRRTAMLAGDDLLVDDIEDLLRGFWDSNCHEDTLTELNFMVQDSSTISSEVNETNLVRVDPFNSIPNEPPLEDPVAKSYKKEDRDAKAATTSFNFSALKDDESEVRRKKKKKAAGVVYPFAVVRPGGSDEVVTLADINDRLRMRPTRPVRHPVGEFACMPFVSGHGIGVSGKAIVGFTRVHTQGRGTITIIRTKG